MSQDQLTDDQKFQLISRNVQVGNKTKRFSLSHLSLNLGNSWRRSAERDCKTERFENLLGNGYHWKASYCLFRSHV